ncbi:MAG: Unknown protein [uncultured Sulfurovum sp.]|uniref:Uncharacterized protein n=1 Tax=uncultured Sulfurovum sp. TaxID=269237 RepID=A0A6S6SM29_9BACT|nr:MAG: Unknown protein [uncultured Sulfurovum sp.]
MSEKGLPPSIKKRYESNIKEYLKELDFEKGLNFTLSNKLTFFKRISFFLFFVLLCFAILMQVDPSLFSYEFYVSEENIPKELHVATE